MQNWRHLCIDMQRVFAEDTPWHVEWMDRVSPQVSEIAGRFANSTIFTRFVPPIHASDLPGKWQDYYTKWRMMTGEHLSPELIDLIAPLKQFVPPARIFDKFTYSPWHGGHLHQRLTEEHVTQLVISGGETDVCVLATVLGAIDHGYDVILLEDAVCGGADETHEASLTLLRNRFSVQLSVVTTGEFLSQATAPA